MPTFGTDPFYKLKSLNVKGLNFSAPVVEDPNDKIKAELDIEGKRLANAEARKKALKGAGLDEKDEKMFKKIAPILAEIATKLEEIPGKKGIPGRITGLAGLVAGQIGKDPAVFGYEEGRGAKASNIARGMGETGNLAQGDVARALGAIPSSGTGLEERASVLRNTYDTMRRYGVDLKPEDAQVVEGYINKYLGTVYEDKVNVINPQGKKVAIKASDLEEALSKGYKKAGM